MTPILVDNFAGGGGASTGIEAALGRAVDIAINHDPEAVAMHAANHPGTHHFCQSIMAVDPLVATGGRPVALAWFSPDCKHHSKAKGGKPREKNIRDLAWIVVHWAERLRKATPGGIGAPAVIMLENVEEFRQWGPLDADGKPIPERRGEEFDLWLRGLKRQGYKVQYRELRACDYGAPTSRKRLFLIARRDGLPIVWPEPTHGKPGSPEVISGQRKPWRTAAECIDWSIPCRSIFDRDRPLKDTTHRRIAHGVMRYVVNAAIPFIVGTAFTSSRAARTFDPQDPLRTTTAQEEFAVIDPTIAPLFVRTAHGEQDASGKKRGRGSHSVEETFPTVTASQDSALVSALITPFYGEKADGTVRASNSVDEPLRTATCDPRFGVVAAHLEKFSENSRGRPGRRTARRGDGGCPAPRRRLHVPLGGQGDPRQPAKTVTSEGQHHSVVAAHLEQANTGRVGHPVSVPVSTIMGQGVRQRLVETTMIPADALPPAVTERAVKVAAFLIKYYGTEAGGHGLDAPIGTVTTLDRFAVVTVQIDAVTYVITDIGMRMLTPRELARAQGFPDRYILDAIGPNGKPLNKTAQIRMIGNSVCPDMARALVTANVSLDAAERVAA